MNSYVQGKEDQPEFRSMLIPLYPPTLAHHNSHCRMAFALNLSKQSGAPNLAPVSYKCHWSVEDDDSVTVISLVDTLVTSMALTSPLVSLAPRLAALLFYQMHQVWKRAV